MFPGSSSDGWQQRAACQGLPLELFIGPDTDDLAHDEDWDPPAEVKAICEPCPVRPECLDWAISYDVWGYWAATSRHQRRQLRRARRRLVCPACGADTLLAVAGVQVCGVCATSWRTTSALT